MQKKIEALLMTFFTFILNNASACDCNGDRVYWPTSLERAIYRAQEIVEYLDARDLEGLKSMFSPYIQNHFDLDTELEILFDKYGGKSLPYDWEIGTTDFSNGCAPSGGVDSRGVSYSNQTYWIRNLAMDNGTVIEIRCYEVEDHPNEDNVGLADIEIRDPNNDYKTIYRVGDVSLVWD